MAIGERDSFQGLVESILLGNKIVVTAATQRAELQIQSSTPKPSRVVIRPGGAVLDEDGRRKRAEQEGAIRVKRGYGQNSPTFSRVDIEQDPESVPASEIGKPKSKKDNKTFSTSRFKYGAGAARNTNRGNR